MPGQVEQLQPVPTIEDEGWAGYQHFTDPTRLPFNVLTYPSHNCSMPSSDKIVPDLGKKLLGQQWTENSGMMGNKGKFTTNNGEELEVRVWSSQLSLLISISVGTFAVGEAIIGGSSGAAANIVSKNIIDLTTNELVLRLVTGTFSTGETITGQSSGATATILVNDTLRGDVIEVLHTSTNKQNAFFGIPHWYQITQTNTNPFPRGLHRYSFDQWFDTNLNPAKSFNVPRLVWTNGNPTIYSWVGSLAEIVNVTNQYLSISTGLLIFNSTVGTFVFDETITGGSSGATAVVSVVASLGAVLTIVHVSGAFTVGETVTGGTSGATGVVGVYNAPQGTWAALGFNSGSAGIIINGLAYTAISGWNTASLEFAPTSPTVHPGDIAFSAIEADNVFMPDGSTPQPLDYCLNNKNYMYYGWWKNRKLFQSNAFNKDASGEVTLQQADLDDLFIPSTSAFTQLGSATFRITITTAAGTDKFTWKETGGTGGGASAVSITGAAQTLADGVQIQFQNITGHSVGDYWEIEVVQAVSKAWTNFYYTLPIRKPGEGYIFRLPSNFWTMDNQEDKLYVNCQFGEWSVIDTELSSDLASETVSLSPLKQSGSLKVIDPWMTGHMDDNLVFITLDKSLMNIGRQAFLQDPQNGYMSDPVKYDFLPCSFIGGSIRYIGKKLYISSPEQGIMHCLDAAKNYWQPPKTFPEVGMLSIVANDLICHSNIRNQTFTMFKSVDDNGQSYEVLFRTPLNSYFRLVNRKKIPARWDSKISSLSFVEGYITGNPQLFFTAFLGPNDPNGKSHLIKPVVLNNAQDKASIGEGAIGTHPLGNDLAVDGSYFNEIYDEFKPIMTYYFIALQISCRSKNHSYSILSVGVNLAFSPSANNTLYGDRSIK